MYYACISSESSQDCDENLMQLSESPDISTIAEELLNDDEDTATVSVDNLNMFVDLMDNLKIKYYSEETSKKEKLQILTLMPLSWPIKEIQKHFGASKYMVKLSRKLQNESGPLVKPSVNKGHLTSEMNIKDVINFYKSEDNSYILPGIRDCVKYKDTEGNFIYEQKHLLLCTLKELYRIFCDQSNISIGFSTFAKLRPTCCVFAGSNGTHSVCVCSIHHNVKLTMSGCNLEKLTNNSVHHFEDYKAVLKFIICEENETLKYKCYFGNCDECPGIEHLEYYSTEIFDENEIEEVTYAQWIYTPRTH